MSLIAMYTSDLLCNAIIVCTPHSVVPTYTYNDPYHTIISATYPSFLRLSKRG